MATLNVCKYLEKNGFNITRLPVNENGLIDLAVLESSITEQTLLFTVLHLHNEIGVIQPLKEVGAICRKKGVFFHIDAAQSIGKVPLNVEEDNIDMISITGHKIYGPKGIGALYIRKKPRVRVVPIINGGGQERGMRSGTLAPSVYYI